MKNIVIFGSSDHAKVVFSEIVKLNNYNILGFVDNSSKKGKKIISWNGKSYFNLGSTSDFIKKNKIINTINMQKKAAGIIGVGFNYFRKKIRNEVYKLDKNFEWEKIISKQAVLNGNVKIGSGTLIMSGVIINRNTVIGKHCIINTSSSIDHDNFFKNYSSCGPGVVTGGNVCVGNNSYLAIGSVVKHGIKIGNNTVIGGNSFVNKNCFDSCIYYGSPIVKIRKRKINENYL